MAVTPPMRPLAAPEPFAAEPPAPTPRPTPAGARAAMRGDSPVEREPDKAKPIMGAVDHLQELELVGHVRNLFYRARNRKRPLIEKWTSNYRTLHIAVPAANTSWRPDPRLPEIFPIVDAIIAWSTDQTPTFDVSPYAEPNSPYYNYYAQLAADLRTTMRANWYIEDYDAEVEKVCWDAFTYGVGIFKASWDSTRHHGMGNAILQRVDPFAFYWDPDAKNMDEANYFIEVKTMAHQDLELRFPGALKRIGLGFTEGHDVAPDMLNPDAINTGRAKANAGAISPATTPSYGQPGQTDRLAVSDDPGVTVFEAWLKVPVTAPAFPEVDGDPTTVKRDDRVYAAWRCVVIAGNHVLFNESADNIWSHGQHPYERFVVTESGEFVGQALVTLLAPMQTSINRLLASMEQNIDLMGNPVFKESNRAGISRQTITNKPGQRLRVNDGGEADWLQPPQMHPQMSSDLVRFYIGEMERVSGLSAVVRGASPTGRNAQGVIDSVQEAAFVRIRKGIRNLNRALRKQGDKLATLITEFYDSPRIIAMVGPSGETTSLALHGQHFYTPTDKGRVPMRFQLMMNVDSSMPTSRQARASEADALFGMGAIDVEAVLDAHDWPNRHLIIQRVREMQAQQGTLGQPPGQRAATRS